MRIHGHAGRLSKSPEYKAWENMISRCYRVEGSDYHNYGGRGISVCSKWRASFEAFLADVGPRPSSKHSLDRWPDNEGNYEPGNTRWATKLEQNNNRRDNRVVIWKGKRLTITELSRVTGVSWRALNWRIACGLAPEKAVSHPKWGHIKKRRNTIGKAK